MAEILCVMENKIRHDFTLPLQWQRKSSIFTPLVGKISIIHSNFLGNYISNGGIDVDRASQSLNLNPVWRLRYDLKQVVVLMSSRVAAVE